MRLAPIGTRPRSNSIFNSLSLLATLALSLACSTLAGCGGGGGDTSGTGGSGGSGGSM